MAYGEKYSLEFGDDPHHGNTWRAEIHQDGYVGSVTDVKGTGKPVSISWKGGKLFEPIRSSECILELYSETNFQYNEFFVADEFEYIIKVKKNGSIYWQGIYIPESYSEPYIDIPYPVKFRFSDGIGLLKYIRIPMADLDPGPELIINIINKCFGLLPYSLNVIEAINVLPNGITDIATNGFLNKIYLNEFVFTELNKSTGDTESWNCHKILKELMNSIGCTLYQNNNKWYIIRIEEAEEATPEYIEYTAGSSTISSTGTITLRETVTNTNTGIIWIEQSGELSPSNVYDQITCTYQYGTPENPANELINDWEFDNNASSNSWALKWNMWELGSGIPLGLSRKEFFPKNALWDIENDDWIWQMAPSFNQSNTIFDSTKYIKPLYSTVSNKTFPSLITDVNDKSIISIGPVWVNYFISDYIYNGSSDPSLLQIIYELDWRISIQVGTYYIEQDNDGNLSWGNDSAATISIKMYIKWPENFYYYYTYDISGSNASLDGFFKMDLIQLELPTFPETNIIDLNIKIFPPVTAAIYPYNTYPSIYLWTPYWYVSQISYKLLPGSNNILNDKQTIITNTGIRDRRLEVTTLFGDGPHEMIKNSFLYFNGSNYVITENWIKRGETIDNFTGLTISDNGSGFCRYESSTDTHSFAVGDYVLGSGFTDPFYNNYQKVTAVLSTTILYTDLAFKATDTSGTLSTFTSSNGVFITNPYARYLGGYRKELRGILFGEFDFFNTIVSRYSDLYFQNQVTFDIKSGEYQIELTELIEAPGTREIDEDLAIIDDTIHSIPDGTLSPDDDNTYPEMLSIITDHPTSTTTQSLALSPESSSVSEVNDKKGNLSDSTDYPQ
tara:strand:- start:3342 stop:5870 length:2529 start_codon:yes stop_codon:yes gene_type:complete